MPNKYSPFPTVLTILVSATASLAEHTLRGRVLDEFEEPLVYATVVLLSPADSTVQYFDVADKEGLYEIEDIKAGDYLMQFSFVAKQIIYRPITVPPAGGEDLGDTILQAALLDEVEVTAEYVPIEIKQDTLSFNAKAFKTRTGAVAEDLLKKIPGVEVDQAGNVKALGEEVKNVLVDGVEFFGKDPKVATKNLPAKAVDKVEIYDKKSDEAEFTGIDDGVRARTVNLLLNEDSKRGYFGAVEVGGGSGEHYNSGAKIYRFSSTVQTALLGMYNNVNEFKFTGRDMGEFGRGVSGLNTTGAGGLNLSYSDTRANKYYASYLVSSTDKDVREETATENFTRDNSYDQFGELERREEDRPHKINMGLRHKFARAHSVFFEGDIAVHSTSIGSQLLGATHAGGALINQLDQTTRHEQDRVDLSLGGSDIIKLDGDDTQLKTELSLQYNTGETGLDWTNRTVQYAIDSTAVEAQFRDEQRDYLRLAVNPTLVRKIGPLWYLRTGLGVATTDSQLEREQSGAADGRAGGGRIDSLSADFTTEERSLRPSLSLWRNTSKTQFRISLEASWRRFDKLLGGQSVDRSEYFYLLPSLSYANSYRKGRRLSLNYRTSITMPSVDQLLPIRNTVNTFSQYQGNLGLKPAYRHSLNISWSLFDPFSFTSLFARASLGYSKDPISGAQIINDDFTRLHRPVNVSSNYWAAGNIYFSTPVRRLGLKLNASVGENWNRGISLVNGAENVQTNLIHSLDLNVENRKKGLVDVRLGGSVSLTDARFSIAADNIFFNTRYYVDIAFEPNEQWSFSTETNVVNFNAKSFDEAVSIPLASARISYYLKGEKATLTLEAVDLFDKNSDFRRISEANYLQQQERNTLGRYAMLLLQLKVGRY